MVFQPNANWTAAIAENPQKPQYFMRFDGLSSVQYSTHFIKTASRTTKFLLGIPSSSRSVIDLQSGSSTAMTVDLPIVDDGGEMADLVGWDRRAPTLGTLVNRKVQVFAGYAHLAEADYAIVFTGRIKGVKMTRDMNGFVFSALDFSTQFDQDIMLGAGERIAGVDNAVTVIFGNVVNIVWSIMSGTFSTSDPTFPLDFVSADGFGFAAPTGLNIPATEINSTQLVEERDRWFPNVKVGLRFSQATDGRAEIETEFMRTFAMFQTLTGDGKLGFKHRIPVLPVSSATVIDDTLTAGISRWQRRFDLHANRFRVTGLDAEENEIELYSDDTTEDIADRAATGVVITMSLLSTWIREQLNGPIVAAVLASRNRFLFQSTPATFTTKLVFTQRALEIGDSISLTHPALPDLKTGTRGVVEQVFMVIGHQPNFLEGVIEVDLLDTRYLRYGIIGPNTLPDYGAATTAQRNTYTFVGDATNNEVGAPLEAGYKII